MDNQALALEVGQLIIDTLNLDMQADEIEPDAYLFGEGLALDSIDALELAMAITQTYGFQLRSNETKNTQIFRSLRTLTTHIHTHKASNP